MRRCTCTAFLARRGGVGGRIRIRERVLCAFKKFVSPPNTATILTTTSWLMPLWERVGDVQQGCLQTWIKENVRFSVIAQCDSSNCTRPQPASLVDCVPLKSVYRTLQTAFPHSEFFDYSPASSSLPRRPNQTACFTECLSSLLLLQLGPLSWTAREGRGGPVL